MSQDELIMESLRFVISRSRMGMSKERILQIMTRKSLDHGFVKAVFVLLEFVSSKLELNVPVQKILEEMSALKISYKLSISIIKEMYNPMYPGQLLSRVGRHTYGFGNITQRSWAEPTHLFVGSFCSIANHVSIFLGDGHRTDLITTYAFGHIKKDLFPHHGIGIAATNGDVRIGNDVWLCSGCTIMSGVTIGDGAVVAANAHVVKNVDPYEIVGGNPAKRIKRRFTDEQIGMLLDVRWWELPDEQIASLVPYLCSNDIDLAIEKIKNCRNILSE